jgi:formyl-CoA transferase
MQGVFPKLSRTPGSIRSLAPQVVGEHSADILTQLLGLSPEAIAELATAGVIEAGKQS